MKVQDFINKLKEIEQLPTTYYSVSGGDWAKWNGTKWNFDCVILIKAILWGWNGDKNASHGGANYGSNGVYDDNADTIMNRCSNISTDFNNIAVGEVLHMKGHVGVYIGNRKVIECTAAWEKEVLISDIGTDGTRSRNGVTRGKWLNHAKLPYIEYGSATVDPVVTNESVRELQHALNVDFNCELAEDNVCGPLTKGQITAHNIRRGAKGQFVRWVQTRLIAKGYSCGNAGIDGDFGEKTEIAVKKYQEDKNLKVDGIVGLNTTLMLLN